MRGRETDVHTTAVFLRLSCAVQLSHLLTSCHLCVCWKKVNKKQINNKKKEKKKSRLAFVATSTWRQGPSLCCPAPPPPPRSTSGSFGVHLVGGYDRIQNQRGTSKPACPFPFPAVSVVSPRKICWLTPSRRSPIDQEEDLEGRGEERDGNKVRRKQPTWLWFIYYFIF